MICCALLLLLLALGLVLAGGLVYLFRCSGAHLSGNCDARRITEEQRLRGRFGSFAFAHGGFCHLVYFGPQTPDHAKRPPVLVLHELPGLTHETFLLATRLIEQGFAVYLPLFFGEPEPLHPGQAINLKNTVLAALNGEWAPFASAKSQPITAWLRALIREELVKRHPARRIGALGMCMTGAMPIALLGEPEVRAAVVCQPSLPSLACSGAARFDLGISDAELSAAASRSEVGVLGLRFEGDTISRGERFETLRRRFGERFIDATIGLHEYASSTPPIPKHAHATLTLCFYQSDTRDGAGHPNGTPSILTERWQRLVTFLGAHLG